ncbi:filamentous hemagglutinin N-terminal domain-containing protein [Burkholderia sp. R-69608]|uniref:filamentous hemagglutinin N-terminal domain-containing protein n=1 Tax=Paraburkholderia nemoris TaxID=2793076 RepID=UPI0019127051|nr:filamentous hemagglutinin N-terminal domain-containing protein [Paraburkholderia nemoris]MBK5152394.1 filamentous hemagglutinin N-terminal domain-containing protein [Burkholderia sp. R-69608]
MSSSVRGGRAGHGSRRLHQFQFRRIVVTPIAARTTYAIGISVGGGTAATISIAVNGHHIVNIALTVAGFLNHTDSDVAGALRNNVGIAARTIVKRATGIHPSIISGSIDVVGPRANVILANPNGSAANGGSFAVKWARACSGFVVQNSCVDSDAITRST